MWIVLTWTLTLFLVTKYGFTGISMASFLVTLTIVVTVQLLKRYVKFSFVRPIIKPIFSCFLMGLGMFVVQIYFAGFLAIILSGATGVIIYLTLSLLIDRKEIMANFGILLSAYKK